MHCKYLLYLLSLLLFCQCHNSSSSDSSLLPKKELSGLKPSSDTVRNIRVKKNEVARGPVINITDTTLEKMNILCVKDSALTQERLAIKLSYLFDTILTNAVLKYKLKPTGSPVAFYKKKGAPYFFEAGIPVNNKIAVPSKKFYYKTLPLGKAVVAHFFGPKDLLSIAYGSLEDYIKNQKFVKTGNSFEIYFPSTAIKEKDNPYKQQTDVVIPIK